MSRRIIWSANSKLMPRVSRLIPRLAPPHHSTWCHHPVARTRRSGQEVAKHLQTGRNIIQPACVQNIGKYELESIRTTALARVRNLIMPHLNVPLRRTGGPSTAPPGRIEPRAATMCCERKRKRLGRMRALGSMPGVIRLEGGGGVKRGIQ